MSERASIPVSSDLEDMKQHKHVDASRDVVLCIRQWQLFWKEEIPMRELLIAAAERSMRYLEGLNGRSVAPDPAVVARLAELDIRHPWQQIG
jgi:hypothetical protein